VPPTISSVLLELFGILPTISNQTKWKYVRTKNGLKLTDGNLVYSFGGMPEEFPAEDTRISRLADDNILDFDKGAINKGTAQIHRASPDNIYMTLANGAHNPTFMLQHEAGKNWRYSPSKKFIQKLKALQQAANISPTHENISVDPAALVDGATDTVKQAIENPYLGAGMFDAQSMADTLNNAAGKAGDALSWMGNHPLATGLGTYAASNLLTGHPHPTRQGRTRQALLPVALGAIPPAILSASMLHR
jgi:hypothetical protein